MTVGKVLCGSLLVLTVSVGGCQPGASSAPPTKAAVRKGDPPVVVKESPLKRQPELVLIDLQSKLTTVILADDELSKPGVILDFDVTGQVVTMMGQVPTRALLARAERLARQEMRRRSAKQKLVLEVTVKR